MRVQLKLVLDAPPDAVWDALKSPSVLGEISHPLLSFAPVEARGLPHRWDEGAHPVAVSALWGLVPVGHQSIDIHFSQHGETRVLEDSGGPIDGALAVITSWRHRMAVAPAADGRTFYRDRLDISAGVLTPFVWIGTWAFWQWRAAGLKRLAVTWRS
ncbi:hypothetical protein BH11ACT3_BH11ACT3_12270 [soil metagenome]